MKITYKITRILLVLLFFAWSFSSCTLKGNDSSAISSTATMPGAVLTTTAHTKQSLPTSTLPVSATMPLTSLPLPRVTEIPTVTPFPSEISALLPDECTDLLMYDDYPYMMNECKLPAISPDGKYLAYVTFVLQTVDEGIYSFEAVHVMEIGRDLHEEVHVVKKLNHIGFVEWSSTSKLLFWESIIEGPGVLFVYDPVSAEILATMRAYQNTALQWNPQKNAFYAIRQGGYGYDNCVGELNGYDFQSNQPFPDMYKIFNKERVEEGNPPYSYLVGDNFFIESYSWSPNGARLWVTVTPLILQENDTYGYLVGPREAGAFELSETGVLYSTLAADEHHDYFFDGSLTDPEIISQVYQSRFCPP